jgi:hypothetical protein
VTGHPVQCPQISPALSLTSNLFSKKVTDLLADASPVTDLLYGVTSPPHYINIIVGMRLPKHNTHPQPGLDACKEKERTGLRPPPPEGVGGSSFPFHATPEEKEERKEVLV